MELILMFMRNITNPYNRTFAIEQRIMRRLLEISTRNQFVLHYRETSPAHSHPPPLPFSPSVVYSTPPSLYLAVDSILDRSPTYDYIVVK